MPGEPSLGIRLELARRLLENVSQNEANKTRFYVVSKRANELPGYECAVFAARIAADKLPGVLDAACS
ncbi:MAG: hypothetical protein IJ087_21715 [Eggerthellaceae bacterium]|nr:hypothetical protein [Eggerthellaceae bacterium]